MDYTADAQRDQIAGYLNANAVGLFRASLINISCIMRTRPQKRPLHIGHCAATVRAFGDAIDAEVFEHSGGESLQLTNRQLTKVLIDALYALLADETTLLILLHGAFQNYVI